jgi:hypothetical protein
VQPVKTKAKESSITLSQVQSATNISGMNIEFKDIKLYICKAQILSIQEDTRI